MVCYVMSCYVCMYVSNVWYVCMYGMYVCMYDVCNVCNVWYVMYVCM